MSENQCLQSWYIWLMMESRVSHLSPLSATCSNSLQILQLLALLWQSPVYLGGVVVPALFLANSRLRSSIRFSSIRRIYSGDSTSLLISNMFSEGAGAIQWQGLRAVQLRVALMRVAGRCYTFRSATCRGLYYSASRFLQPFQLLSYDLLACSCTLQVFLEEGGSYIRQPLFSFSVEIVLAAAGSVVLRAYLFSFIRSISIRSRSLTLISSSTVSLSFCLFLSVYLSSSLALILEISFCRDTSSSNLYSQLGLSTYWPY